jgi:uncharacterized protein YpmS
MKKPTRDISLAIVSLVVVLLACTLNVGGPAYPTSEIPISTEAAAQLEQNIQTAIAAGVSSGQVTLIITEPELTSYLYYYLERQSSPLFTNPQVYLQENQIRIHGTVVQGDLQAYIYIVITASADEQGQLNIEMTSADFGPLPVPDGIKTTLTAIIKEAYTGALGPVATGFRLESIVIVNGTMTLTGRIK